MKVANYIILFVLLALGVLLVSNFSNTGEWHPVYYPDATNLIEYTYGPIVETIDECRAWVNSEAMRRNQQYGEYDYECGKIANMIPRWI